MSETADALNALKKAIISEVLPEIEDLAGRTLTRREHIAAMAMQAMLTHSGGCSDHEMAVYHADKLIAELDKDIPAEVER